MKKDFEKRLREIESRNIRVENDKAWETSWTRRIGIAALTYFIVVIYLRFVAHIDPWINGLIPVIGFLLSTLTVSLLKKIWQSHR